MTLLRGQYGVLVLPHARVLAQPGRAFRVEDRGQALPLAEALTVAFTGDAHVVGYTAATPGGKPSAWRLKSDAVGKYSIVMRWLLLDVDAPGHTATPEWREDMRAKLVRLAAVHPGAFIYFTRGGLRIIWHLAAPFPITTAEDAAKWKAIYGRTCDLLERDFGISCDRACSDWSRLYRLPRATRDRPVGPEDHPTVGDPSAIGVFELPELPEAGTVPTQPLRALKISSARVRIGDGGARAASPGRGLLYRLLDRRGDVGETTALSTGVEAFKVRCPRAHLHTTGDDGTILVPAKNGGPGWIKCQHSHCADVTADEWLSCFTSDELAAVGVRLGRIVEHAINAYDGGSTRICLMLDPIGGTEKLPYVRISPNTGAWDALWEATDVDPPVDLDPKGDLLAALHELHGRTLAVELDEQRRVRRILRAA
ncbi:MAG TPA: hypothetical protein VH062_35710 [Polyangiaceae bacterium]|jgi:hypothetical protein|nr:hypothetical protein [Polyangiaceae bacterium]